MDDCPDVSDPYQDDTDQDGVGDACDDTPGFYLLQFKYGPSCLVAADDGDVSSTTTCDPADPYAQWEPFTAAGHDAYRNRGNGQCLAHTDSWIGPWTVVTAGCDDGDDFQQWDYEPYDQGGADAEWPGRLAAVSDDFCVYTDLTGLVYGTIANCDLAGSDGGRKVGVYAYGEFDTAPLVP